MDLLIFIIILLATVTAFILIMYWALKTSFKTLKPEISNIIEMKKKIDSLEKRVEFLEEKSVDQ